MSVLNIGLKKPYTLLLSQNSVPWEQIQGSLRLMTDLAQSNSLPLLTARLAREAILDQCVAPPLADQVGQMKQSKNNFKYSEAS